MTNNQTDAFRSHTKHVDFDAYMGPMQFLGFLADNHNGDTVTPAMRANCGDLYYLEFYVDSPRGMIVALHHLEGEWSGLIDVLTVKDVHVAPHTVSDASTPAALLQQMERGRVG